MSTLDLLADLEPIGRTPGGSRNASARCDRMGWAPVVVWYMPVKNADRLGAHAGLVANTCVYRVP